jgi:ABC-2 type transport system ATP-binding protein
MTNAIDVAGLTKIYGPTRALDGLDLVVREGDVHGFLGPNGAGKTTTIRILLGLAHQDAGTATVLGGDPWRDATTIHRRLAYVPGDVTLWPTLTGGEVIDLLGRLRGGVDPKRRDDLLGAFELDPRKKCRTYSKGNRQKVALVAALASDAELLILDEPTSGLDPLMERIFSEHITAERRSGRTVLLSSHILSEVQTLCDHVSIIRAGRNVESMTMTDLRRSGASTIRAELDRPSLALATLPGVHDLVIDDRGVVRGSVDTAALDVFLRELVSAGVRDLEISPPTLEDLFLEQYRDVSASPVGVAPQVTR